MKLNKTMILGLLALGLASCGGGRVANPVDRIIKANYDSEAFAVILYDMEIRGNFFKHYYHQYHVVVTKDDKTTDEKTEWLEVPQDYFEKNQDNMGMELVSKSDGKVSKIPSPPGYSHYVGNSRYGSWHHHNGSSFWTFYGQYAFMNALFNTGRTPINRRYYDDYHDNYRGRRAYYGPTESGRRYYGSNSTYSRTNRQDSKWRRSGQSYTYRNASRYSSKSFTSRSGGYGK